MNLLVADTSAWHHAGDSRVIDQWRSHLAADRIAATPPMMLEVLYSARSAHEYAAIAQELAALRHVPCGAEAFERALAAQRALAERAPLHHRSVKIVDLLIAAAAELAGAAVWHYDSDYDRISEITGQHTEWIAPRSTL
ncbi:MAG: PIN domain-containing protein [Acidimicrobiia bacterium]